MSVQEIEKIAEELPTSELDQLITRLSNLFNERWDRQIKEDAEYDRIISQ